MYKVQIGRLFWPTLYDDEDNKELIVNLTNREQLMQEWAVMLREGTDAYE